MSSINELLSDCHPGHDNVQIGAFMIVRNGGTLWGCYKQSLLELRSRISALKRAAVTYEEIDTVLAKEEDPFKLKKTSIDAEETEQAIHTLVRESAVIYQIADNLKEQLIEKHGELTPDLRKELDEDLWTFKLKCRIACEYKDTNSISENTRSQVKALPSRMRRPIQKAMTDLPLLSQWYDEGESVDVPELVQPSNEAVGVICSAFDTRKAFEGRFSSVGAPPLQLLDSEA